MSRVALLALLCASAALAVDPVTDPHTEARNAGRDALQRVAMVRPDGVVSVSQSAAATLAATPARTAVVHRDDISSTRLRRYVMTNAQDSRFHSTAYMTKVMDALGTNVQYTMELDLASGLPFGAIKTKNGRLLNAQVVIKITKQDTGAIGFLVPLHQSLDVNDPLCNSFYFYHAGSDGFVRSSDLGEALYAGHGKAVWSQFFVPWATTYIDAMFTEVQERAPQANMAVTKFNLKAMWDSSPHNMAGEVGQWVGNHVGSWAGGKVGDAAGKWAGSEVGGLAGGAIGAALGGPVGYEVGEVLGSAAGGWAGGEIGSHFGSEYGGEYGGDLGAGLGNDVGDSW